jgi:hypothetical protein
MSNNIQATPGSGITIAADEANDGTLGLVKVPYVKLMDGTEDGTTRGTIGAKGLTVGLGGTVLTSATLQNAASATGNGTEFSIDGMATVRMTVAITGTATIIVEGREDASTFNQINAERLGYVPSSTITASGLYTVHVAGLQAIRARISVIGGASSVTVTAHASSVSTAPFLPKNLAGDVLVTLNGQIAGEDLVVNTLGSTFKPVNSVTFAPERYLQSGTVTKASVKATPGNVYALRVTNSNASPRYFQLHNSASAPSAAASAQLYFTIPGGSTAQPSILELGPDFFAPSEYFNVGIGWAISTSVTTFTDSATASEHSVHVRYV